MSEQVRVPPEAVTSFKTGSEGVCELRGDVAYLTTGIVNVVFIGFPNNDWVLVDTGIYGYGDKITMRRKIVSARPPSRVA